MASSSRFASKRSGVEIVPVYDRSSLIERAIKTLKDTLIEEMIIAQAEELRKQKKEKELKQKLKQGK